MAFLGPATTGLTTASGAVAAVLGHVTARHHQPAVCVNGGDLLIITVKRMRKNGQVRVDTAVESAEPLAITGRHKLILLTCAVTLILFMVGTVQLLGPQ
ncbi:hypothetical protein LZ023_36665 (plasmid) [Pseudomonas silvicola]|nr:hypothetical protein LZ023_36665 [Pseudomonas silvicola]